MAASWGIGLLSLRQGDLRRALPRLERAVDICQDVDFLSGSPGWLRPWVRRTLWPGASPTPCRCSRRRWSRALQGKQLPIKRSVVSPWGRRRCWLAVWRKHTPFIVHLHGKPFVQYAEFLFLAHERGLVSLKAYFISITAESALAEAEATFTDGKTYGECADSTPQNVGATVKAHFPRIALTRAKACVLCDALKIGIAALDKLDGE
jgi:hypothetical protein